jgi:EpsG family
MSVLIKNAMSDVYGVLALVVALGYSLVSGLRGVDIGTDTSTYIYIFEAVLSGGELNREVEVGFNSLILFVSLFGGVEFFFSLISLAVILFTTNIFNTGFSWKFLVSFVFRFSMAIH